MIRKSWRWLASHRKTTSGLILLMALVLLNLVAYLHAHAMTHYAAAGNGTSRPESLTALQKLQVLFTGVTVPRPAAGNRSPQGVGLPYTVHHFPGAGVELEAWHVPHPDARGLVLLFHG